MNSKLPLSLFFIYQKLKGYQPCTRTAAEPGLKKVNCQALYKNIYIKDQPLGHNFINIWPFSAFDLSLYHVLAHLKGRI